MRSVKISLAVAIAFMVIAIGTVLSRAPLTVAGTNGVPTFDTVAIIRGNASTCQYGTLPRGTSAIRVSLGAGAGPRLRLRVLSGSRLITQGERPPGWGLEANVVVPVRAISHRVPRALICLDVGPAAEPVEVFGVPRRRGSSSVHGLKDARLCLEYLRPGPKSWWSSASSVIYHVGLGHAASGEWLAYLVLAMMLTIAVLSTRLAWKELR